MKIGDIVSRKKYHQDIIFEVIDIQENICYLRGIEYRLIADSEIDDLELVQDKRVIEDVHLPQEKCLKGSVLHLDGDPSYLKMCMKKYQEYGIRAYGYYFKEEEFASKITNLLKKHNPHLLVITGHDALKKNGHKRNSQDYLHSLDFVEAIKKAREYQPDKDALVIFAVACQSYYELPVASGANFASSPSRKNIHALDPVIITTQIASTNIKEYVDLEKVIEKTSFKQRRKTIYNNLKQEYQNALDVLNENQIDQKLRCEQLTLEDYQAITKSLYKHTI